MPDLFTPGEISTMFGLGSGGAMMGPDYYTGTPAGSAPAPAPMAPPTGPTQSDLDGSAINLPAQAGLGGAPGYTQSMIGLGLGLLAGTPFNRYGAAMTGYQQGAQADLARATEARQAAYQQQSLAQQRAQADLARAREARQAAYQQQS